MYLLTDGRRRAASAAAAVVALWRNSRAPGGKRSIAEKVWGNMVG